LSRTITFVLARADNGVIGKEGALPWRIPADMRHFKRLTLGSAMIMGRKTFDSFPRPLPDRRHIVLTRDRTWHRPGAETARDVQQALDLAGSGPITVIGGAEIYGLFLRHADAIELTEVHAAPDGDTIVPDFEEADWREASREDHPAELAVPAYSFVRLERR
jgi:dihydrofolate reductase